MKITLLYLVTTFLAISLYAQAEKISSNALSTRPSDTFNLSIINSPVSSIHSNQTVQEPAKPIPYALVAGGSKGIGYAIAEALARRGYNLILIARHADSLHEAKIKLESLYKIQVEVLSFDLSRDESATQIAEWCTVRNIPLKMLCNVAGFGGAKDYLSLSLDSLRYMINLN